MRLPKCSVIVIALAFLLGTLVSIAGCGGGGGGGGSSDVPGLPGDNTSEPEIKHPPVITNVKATDAAFEVSDTFTIGEKANLVVSVLDVKMDMQTLSVTEYYPRLNPTPYRGPTTFDFPAQTQMVDTYTFVEAIDITGPAGEWLIEVQIEDAAGNESDTFKHVITVEE